MKTIRTASIVLGAILAVPIAGFAAPAAAPGQATGTTATSPKPATPPASHSARGVVKSIDANTLVIERKTKKKTKELTFALDATTVRNGDIKVGSTVSVHYKNDASKLMALDVQPVKAKAAARKAAAH